MQIRTDHSGRKAEIIALVRNAFAGAYGADEGNRIADLMGDLMRCSATEDLHLFCAEGEGELVAVVAFTRLHYAEDPRRVALLSPMAVAPGWQRQGIGQTLIRAGLTALRTGATTSR